MKIPNWKRVTHALLSPAGKANEVKYLVDMLPPGADNQTVFAAVGQARKKGIKISISQKMGVWYYIREINAQEARALCPLPGAHAHAHTAPPPAASETKRCLHLIKAKAPASVSSVDVADFFDISDADADALLFSLSRSRPDILKISIHVKIK